MFVSLPARFAAGIVVAACVFTLSTASAQSPGAQPDPKQVVAVVNGEEIHFGEVAAFVQSLPQQYRSVPLPQLYPHIVDQLVSRKLIAAVAVKDGLENDEDYKRRRAVMEERLLQEVYMQQKIDQELTEAKLKERYEETIAKNPGEAEVHARHILLKTEDEAKAVIAEVNGGADFAVVAKEKSTGPSASKGGDLGFFKRGDMVPEFAEVAFSLKAGEVSAEPVKTQFGWHVIKVEERRDAAPPSFAESVEELRRDMIADLAKSLVDGAREGADIKRFNLDGTAME